MNRSTQWSLCGVALVALGGAFFAGRAYAAGIPSTGALTYSGLLQDSAGAPLAGNTHTLEIKLWSAATSGTMLCDTGAPTGPTALNGGRFSITLQNQCTTAIGANPDAYSEVLLDGVSLGRSKLGAVPYAVEANHAVNADSATTAATASAAGGALKTTIDGLIATPSRVAAHSIAAPFAISQFVWAKVPYLTEEFDDKNEFVPATDVFTAAQAGDYMVCASFNIKAATAWELDTYVNGVRDKPFLNTTAGFASTGCGTVRLAAGDVLDVRIFAGAAASVVDDGVWDWLKIVRIR